MLQLLQVTDTSVAYIVLGGFAVAFSLVSLLVKEKLYINEVVLGTAFGVIIGPYVFGIFDPRSWGSHTNAITLEVMRVVLATGLFAIGVELPQTYMKDHMKSLLVMVVPTMAFGWVAVAAVIYGLFPQFNYISALVIAACLTPTDPIICAAIVGGKFALEHVPANLRLILSAESAANDGLAYPFLSISIYLTVESSVRVAIGKWFLVGWLYQVILGVVLGTLLGFLCCYLMKLSYRKGFTDRQSYLAQYLAAAVFTIGIVRTIGSDDLLAAFAAGTAISWDGHFNDRTQNESFSTVIDLLLNCACFVYIGAWLPFSSFNSPELGITAWRLVVLFVVVLLIRRIPPLLVLFKWIPEIRSWREALFSGHFGPMGVGAVFISTNAVLRLPEPESPPQGQAQLLAATLQPIVSFIVLGSIIIHGLSIPFFSFGRSVGSRTITLTRTWTSRGPAAPDWLLWARRVPGPELSNSDTFSRADPEQGVETTVTSEDGKAHPSIKTYEDAASISLDHPSSMESVVEGLRKPLQDNVAPLVSATSAPNLMRSDVDIASVAASPEIIRIVESNEPVKTSPLQKMGHLISDDGGSTYSNEGAYSDDDQPLPSSMQSSASIKTVHLPSAQ
ncbi:Probable Na(+)/H(+) antiporter [Sparassis crispa]|uniref:Probable Na(+)/H(+) antiporter n=1 Tax=Sparassis crispa TaxID=139825 RepID=A0A401GHA0_9APHY|nr:Probable Na(+)/H(+) antiporter [Sparassis crispa]GBE81584.1 Probable Na(+)/H(+) antiporter [Sparassis crispa]